MSGKPLNAVLAASTRITAVAIEMISTMIPVLWKTASATCTMTVFCSCPGGRPTRSFEYSAYLTPVLSAIHVMPTNMAIEMTPIISKVFAAFLLLGFLNAGTPLAMASMPVRAVVPDEKDFASKKISAAPAKLFSAVTVQSALSAVMGLPTMTLKMAVPIITKIEPTKK